MFAFAAPQQAFQKDRDGFAALLYEPESAAATATLVIALGGSEGGNDYGKQWGPVLAREGIATLALTYFGDHEHAQSLIEVPIEPVLAAIRWADQSRYDRICLMGVSKGAELAGIVACRMPERIDALLLVSPSHVIWQGIDFENWHQQKSSWSFNAAPLPFVPYHLDSQLPSTYDLYRRSLSLYQRSDALIPFERFAKPILLLVGKSDNLWPSASMARQIKARNSAATLVELDAVGHVFHLPQTDWNDPQLELWGGAPAAIEASTAQVLEQTVDFLRGAE